MLRGNFFTILFKHYSFDGDDTRAFEALKKFILTGMKEVILREDTTNGVKCTEVSTVELLSLIGEPYKVLKNFRYNKGTPVYEKRGPKRCIASPGGPRRVQTYPGLGSTTRIPFSPDTGKPRTAIRGRANPHGSGSVETPLSKHLLSQAPGRRKRQLSDSDSDTDESVVSSVELKRAKTDAAFWWRRYTEACQEKAKLTNIIESMQRTTDGKLAARGDLGQGAGAAAAGLSLEGGAARLLPPGAGGSSRCSCRGAGALQSAAKISGETWVALDSERGAGPLRTTSAKLPFDKKENRFLASGANISAKFFGFPVE
ncbi:hypothetical protein ISCGN_018805 [Ixodes scapularis]